MRPSCGGRFSSYQSFSTSTITSPEPEPSLKLKPSFDDRVGAGKDFLRDGDSKQSCGLHVHR